MYKELLLVGFGRKRPDAGGELPVGPDSCRKRPFYPAYSGSEGENVGLRFFTVVAARGCGNHACCLAAPCASVNNEQASRYYESYPVTLNV